MPVRAFSATHLQTPPHTDSLTRYLCICEALSGDFSLETASLWASPFILSSGALPTAVWWQECPKAT
jgi:hypothetical protein